jgi:hypothetical protein
MNKWPLSALVTIIALFAASVGSFAVTKYQASDTAKKVEKICEQREKEKSEILTALANIQLSMEKQNTKTELIQQEIKYIRIDINNLR